MTTRRLRYHFSGIAGAGMSPLARLVRERGHEVQGSDRAFDQGKSQDAAAALARLGIVVKPHDGTAVTPEIDRFVHSTAVETETPEMRAARDLGIELVPRPALLAEILNAGHPGVAIAGTSGKSTITGMVAWLVRKAGLRATVLGGAALVGDAGGGCLVAGPEDGPVVAEACESDGTLIGYRPAIGLVHNISRDHDELPGLREQFARFGRQCGKLLVNAACPEAAALQAGGNAFAYGDSALAHVRLEVFSAGPDRGFGVLNLPSGLIALDVPQPGLHNLENAAAATLVALELGMRAEAIEELMPRFPGVARRFEVIGTTPAGIWVVDDYAHNAEKIRAAITTAQAGARRVVVLFQPHGYGPARFLRPQLTTLLPRLLRPQDRFCYAEIFYAGGTVARDISSRMLAEELPPQLQCGYAPDHAAAIRWVKQEARRGDTILIMGARDPELPNLARSVLAALQPERSAASAGLASAHR